MDKQVNTTKRDTEPVLHDRTDVGLGVNTEKPNYKKCSHAVTKVTDDITTKHVNTSFENVGKLKYLY